MGTGIKLSKRSVLWPLGALTVLTVVGFLAFPTYPNYDTYYSLVWGRDLLHGHLPNFDAYYAPTEHPLAILFGAFLSLFGTGADRLAVLATLFSFVGLIAAVFRVGQVLYSPLVGLLAALLVLTRFDFPFLAIRAYVDIPFMTLIVAAAALEVSKPKRGLAVMLLLVAAGLLRPEAWVLAGLYFLYLSWRASWRARLLYLGLAGFAPLVWFGTDWVVTGDPLFSLHATRELAGELDRQRPLSDVPSLLVQFFTTTVKLPVAILGIAGFFIGLARFRSKILVPTVLLLSGVVTFVASAAVGLSAIPRYLLVPSIALCIFAALAIGGFITQPRPRYWRLWATGSYIAVVLGIFYTALNAPVLSKFGDEIAFQGDIHRSIKETLADPEVDQAVDRCGLITVPTHKFVPDVIWAEGLIADKVQARAKQPATTGVAIYVFGRKASGRYGDAVGANPLTASVPPPDFKPVSSSRSRYTVAYVNCDRKVTR